MNQTVMNLQEDRGIYGPFHGGPTRPGPALHAEAILQRLSGFQPGRIFY